MKKTAKRALSKIKKMGGTIRTSDIVKGKKNTKAESTKSKDGSKEVIHPRTLYELRDEGYLTQISRGVYQLAEKPISNPDFVTIGMRAPRAVVCLVSALAFHNITTQIPRSVSIAILKDTTIPRIDNPPISVHKFSAESFAAGIEEHSIDGISVKIYSTEKTLADCFKYRNKIGIDICIEALKLYKSRKKVDVQKIIKYAKICRVYKIMKPHLESIL